MKIALEVSHIVLFYCYKLNPMWKLFDLVFLYYIYQGLQPGTCCYLTQCQGYI